MTCSICKEEHLTSRCPELAEERKQSTLVPDKENRHDDGGEEEQLVKEDVSIVCC